MERAAVEDDLEDPDDLRRVYEEVLRDGTPADIEESIDVDPLPGLWDELVLPPAVRRRWLPPRRVACDYPVVGG